MPTVNYTAGLAYYDGSWYSDEAAQGCYANYRRTGVLCFAGMNLRGKIINSVSLTITSRGAGSNSSKSAFFYRSSVQRINTSLSGVLHRTGSSIGSVSGRFYNNTLTVAANFLKNRIAIGENTFCIYATDTLTSSWSANYLKWSKVIMTVDYSEPESAPDSPTAPTEISPDYGTLNYYYAIKPTVSWSGATGGEKYVIERAVNSNIHLDSWETLAETTDTHFEDSTLILPLGNYVRYRVKNVAGNQSSGYIYTGNIRRMLPDTAPSGFTANAEQNLVFLSWNGILESFVTYRIEFSTDGENFIALRTTSELNTVHDISALPNGSTVIYRVRAEQASVDSATVITSPYTLSNQITKRGGIYIKKPVWTRGVVWHKHASTTEPARKVFVKFNNHWRESI